MGAEISFGRLIRSRRRALDLTQESLARQVGYSVITIRKVESDERRPSRDLAERLATSLKIAPEERVSFTALARTGTTPAVGSPAATAPPPGTSPQSTPPAAASPPWAGAGWPPRGLPTPLTRLIGREDEVTAVRALLAQPDVRLVTLVGPPGIGKSRLGIGVAAGLRHLFPDGIFCIALEPISDAALVPVTLAKAVGVTEQAGRPLLDVLVEHLRERRLLVLLDNFEHLLDAAPLVAEVLTAGPGPKVLATSRAALHLRGERLFQVPPLAAPGPDAALTAEAAAGYPATQLFVERARAVDPTFTLADTNAAAVATICAGVDGLPLAIELVAARSRLMTPHDMVARLNQRMALGADGPRDAPVHQQALRTTIDWSYNLLEPGEQVLFARLAVFVGGCSLHAAEQVGNDLSHPAGGDLPMTILDGLAALADKNLIGQEERDGERHVVLLGTIREYALERLAASGEEEAVRIRFARACLDLAETACTHFRGEEQEVWLHRLDAAQHNLRAALQWYVERGESEPALRMIAALWTFWHVRFRQTEGLRWVTVVLALPGPGEHPARAEALFGAGWLALDRNDHARAGEFFAESLRISRALRDVPGVATALHGVGLMAQVDGDGTGAVELFTESLQLYRDIDDDEGIAWSLDHLGNAALGQGDYRTARSFFDESLEIFRRLGHSWGIAIALHHQGMAALALGDHERAREMFADGMARFATLANSWGIAISLDHLGYVEIVAERAGRAEGYFVRSLQTSHRENDHNGVARALAGLAAVAVARHDLPRAAALFGGAEGLAEASGILLDPVARAVHQGSVATVRDRLAEEPVATAWESGHRMPLAELVVFATGAGPDRR